MVLDDGSRWVPWAPTPAPWLFFFPKTSCFFCWGHHTFYHHHYRRTQILHTNNTSRFLKIDLQLFKHTFDYTHVLLIFSSTSHQQVKKKLRFLRWCCCCCFMMGTQEFLFFLFLLFHLALGGGGSSRAASLGSFLPRSLRGASESEAAAQRLSL